jgi:glucose/arabinose dehydrogenase
MNRLIRLIWSICLISLVVSIPKAFGETFADSRFSVTNAVTGINLPNSNAIGFTFAPDGRMFIWLKGGHVRIFKNGQLLATPFIDISDHVNRFLDRGLIGLALDPNFSTNGYVYLAYVYEDQGAPTSDAARTQRVTRVQADPANPDKALAGSETVILGKVTDPNCDLTTDCMPNNHDTHTLDHLLFGPDGKLYVSVGDGADYGGIDPNRLRAQNLDALNGKILRINTDGTGPADNPFYDGNPNSNRSKIYNYGLRNPYRFTFDSRNGSLYVGDVGSRFFEEINRGRGANFGWPCYEGPGPDQNPDHVGFDVCKNLKPADVTFPVFSYAREVKDSNGNVILNGAAIMLGPVYDGDVYPSEFKGSIFFGDFVRRWIHRIAIDANGNLGPEQELISGTAPDNTDGPIFVKQGPDGKIYYVMIGSGQIRRIDFQDSGNKPPVAQAAATPTTGLSPLDVTFSSNGSSDPEGGALTYLWDFGDGAQSTEANPTHRYQVSTATKFTAKLTVKDPQNATASATVGITVGSTPPVATITAPAGNISAHVGDTIQYSGSATDAEDGALPGPSLQWLIIIQHNDHFHTMSDNTGSGGSFVVQDHGAIGDTYSYIVRLIATDSSGLKDTKEVRVSIATATPTLTLAAANGGSTSATVTAGQTATYAMQVSGSPGFTGDVAFTCLQNPPGDTCTVTPNPVHIDNGGSQAFTVSVRTAAISSTAGLFTRSTTLTALASAVSVGIFGLCLIGKSGRSRRGILGALAICVILLGLAACGGGTNTPNPQPRQSVVTVTASSGAVTKSMDLQLTVQ